MTATALAALATVGLLGGILLLLPRMAGPTVPFGVRVPPERTDAPVIRDATRRYRWGVAAGALVVAVLTIAATWLAPPEAVLTIAPFVLLGVWFLPFLGARRRVLAAKRAEGWFDTVRQAAATDTSWRTDPPRFPWAWAAPSLLVVLATVVVGIVRYPHLPDRIALHFDAEGPDRYATTTVWTAFGLPILQALLSVLVLVLVAVSLRAKADVSAAAAEVTAEQYRRYTVRMARLVLLVVAGMNVTFLVVALMVWEVLPATGGVVLVSFLPVLVATVALLVGAVRAGQSGHRLPVAAAERSEYADRDDDAHWIGGLIYINRDDPAVLVPKRFGGVGWTLNLARPAAQALLVLIIGATLAVVIWAAQVG